MPNRTPPSFTRSLDAGPIYAFEKSSGTKGSTFYGRLLHRLKFRVDRGNGEVVRAVRYAGRYWPIYEPDTFTSTSSKWVKEGDLVYGPACSELKLPLDHPYLFDCDNPMGHYD